jgi:hypothetical protein
MKKLDKRYAPNGRAPHTKHITKSHRKDDDSKLNHAEIPTCITVQKLERMKDIQK